MRLVHFLLISAALASPVPALAQAAPSTTEPSRSSAASAPDLMDRESLLPAVLSWLQQQGSKLTFLGDDGGLKGYLVEAPTGKMQSVYVTPDGKHIVAGLMIEQGGRNITGVQIGEMKTRFENAAKALDEEIERSSIQSAEQAMEEGESAGNGVTAAESGIPSVPEESIDEGVADQGEADAKASAKAADATALELPAAEGALAAAEGNPSEVWASDIDKGEFLGAVAEVPYFEVGSQVAPVTLYMVADPQCPYCHAAWDHIKPLVFAKQVKARVILINALEGSEPLAREILASSSASRRWIETNAGRQIEAEVDPDSEAWAASAGYLSMNMEFARSFGIDRTPFLAYVAPDGRFYSALGLPSDMPGFLAASGAGGE